MAEIIKFDHSRKKSPEKSGKTGECLHKNVTVFTTPRTVRCAFCGKLLDPFDVLLSMVQGYVPAGSRTSEERMMSRELLRRETETGQGDEKGRD